jgi:hypothetical protein
MNISSGNRMIFQRDHGQVPICRKRAACRDRLGVRNFFAYVGLCVQAINRFSKLWKKLKKITFST